MRKIDESRAANYIRKHSNYKKWLAFVLCLSLLTGTVTLYILNKPATAMTAEGAEGLGVVLETASSADEEELIHQTLENKSVSNDNGDDDLFAGLNEDGDDNDENAGGNGDGDDLNKSGDDEESKEGLVEKEVTEGEAKEGEEAKETEESESKEDELTQDVVLTVSYVDEDGESIADDEELGIEDSFDPASDASSFEGYTFKEATFKGDVITKVAVKKNADDIRYYEVTFDDDETKEIKKDATVVLTYIKDEEEVEVDASVTLTAKYVDKDGEDIQDSEEISFAKETSINKDNAPEIDGYFFMKAVYDGQEIVKITPVETEAEAEDSDNEEETTEETEEVKSVSVEGYEFTTADGDTVEITEDAEIEYTYLKASEETEFTYADGKVTVTATINGKNVFPEGIELKAAEVTKDSSSYNYDAYMDALNENAEAIAEDAGQEQANEFTEDNTLLYDIAFVYEGKEIQPKEGTVTISINFKKNQLSEDLSAASKDDVTVVHLPIKEDVKEENEIVNTEDASDITASDIEVITLTDATAAVEGNEKVEFETEGFSIFAVLAYQHHEPGTDTFETVLGDAVNFGIVAKVLRQKEHAETNFAVGKFTHIDQYTGNDKTNREEQTFIIGEIEGTVYINAPDPFSAYVFVPKAYMGQFDVNGKIYKDTSYDSSQLKSIVNDMLDYTKAASKDLATRTQSSYRRYLLDGGEEKQDSKTVFDFSDYSDGTYYLNVDDAFINRYLWQDGLLNIKKKPGQTIVFNVRCDGPVVLHKYMIDNGDGRGFLGTDTLMNINEDSVASTIIWNFINSPEVSLAGSVAGVFISGKDGAKWSNDRTSSGWVAFDNVDLPGGGEWHNTYGKIRKIGSTAEFQAYKTIDGVESSVSGFQFTLYKQDSSSPDGWKAIDTKTNDSSSPHSVIFDPITYGDNQTIDSNQYQYVNGEETFTYKIVETQGMVGDDGKAYVQDTREFYATVDVKKQDYQLFGRTVFKVSAPIYYYLNNGKRVYITGNTFLDKDGNKVDADGLPVFDNKTTGSVGFNLNKQLDGHDPENETFKFTVQVLKHTNGNSGKGTLIELTNELENIGKGISFIWNYSSDYLCNNAIYFVVTENNPDNGNITKDDDYIIVKAIPNGKTYYKKLDSDRNKNDILRLTNVEKKIPVFEDIMKDANSGDAVEEKTKTFYNTTKQTMLRIHKMVVSKIDEISVHTILKKVAFKVTNTETGEYLIIKDKNSSDENDLSKIATSYDQNGTAKGNSFEVYYNQDAQWTVKGLPVGKYTVEEIADGLTFDQNGPLTSRYSRVTYYQVTFDDNNAAGETSKYGFGGDNKRVVFSADLKEKSKNAPEVTVGGSVPTVQICNFYSMPTATVEVTKNFAGGVWEDGMEFEFEISALGYTAQGPNGENVTYPEGQPMPDSTTVTMKNAGAVRNNDGSYTNVAEFNNIPFRYAGTYKYKIVETQGTYPGVTYDPKSIYVVINVAEDFTSFPETHDNLVYPNGYTSPAHIDNEDLYYLSANVTYYSDYDEATDTFSGEQAEGLAFHNTRTGKLAVTKVWQKIGHTPDETPAITALDAVIQRKVTGGDWVDYVSIQLTPSNNWTWTSESNPGVVIDLMDSDGNEYQYRVVEDTKYLKEFAAVYRYKDIDHPVDVQGHFIGADGTETEGYVMIPTNCDFGMVTITNTRIVTNALPSTGGMGDIPYLATGLGTAVAGLLGAGVYSRKKKKDDEE